jgi:hypothetical protein
MTTTPYEMRYNYYMAAKDQLMAEYHNNFQQHSWIKENNIERPRKHSGWDHQAWYKHTKNWEMPYPPTKEDIFALAEEIKAFAEKK